MKRKLIGVAIAGIALTLVGYGAWRVYAPAGYMAVGLLLWINLSIGTGRA